MKGGRKNDDGKQVKEKNIGHDNGKEKRRVRKNTKRLNKWQKKEKRKKTYDTTTQRKDDKRNNMHLYCNISYHEVAWECIPGSCNCT